MAEQINEPLDQQSLASVEADLFGPLFAFHKKVMALLRQSSLNDEKLKVAEDRIKALLDTVTAEIKKTQQFNVTERLEAAYSEVKRLVDELSGFPDGGKKG